jgi:hypothetical protein
MQESAGKELKILHTAERHSYQEKQGSPCLLTSPEMLGKRPKISEGK